MQAGRPAKAPNSPARKDYFAHGPACSLAAYGTSQVILSQSTTMLSEVNRGPLKVPSKAPVQVSLS